MNIGFFGDGKWAHEAFKLLVNDPECTISFVCLRYDSPDKVLEKLAHDKSIICYTEKNINADQFLDEINKYQCDLFVSMSFNQIFRDPIITMPLMGTINCHAGKLPFYRGRNVLNWVLINDESDFGITVHYMDEGIDTGDIILQETYPITENDDYASLLETAYHECAKLLYDAIMLLKNKEVTPAKQTDIHPTGFYCGIRKEGDEKINWKNSSRDVFNFVRALVPPGPGAMTLLNTNKVIIYKIEEVKECPIYKGIPGQVIGKEKDILIVKTMDRIVRVIDYYSDVKIKVGDRFE